MLPFCSEGKLSENYLYTIDGCYFCHLRFGPGADDATVSSEYLLVSTYEREEGVLGDWPQVKDNI